MPRENETVHEQRRNNPDGDHECTDPCKSYVPHVSVMYQCSSSFSCLPTIDCCVWVTYSANATMGKVTALRTGSAYDRQQTVGGAYAGTARGPRLAFVLNHVNGISAAYRRWST